MRPKLVVACWGLFVLSACGGSVTLRDDAEDRVMAAAERVRELMAAGNMRGVMDQMPWDLVPGGPSQRDAAAAAAEKYKETAQAMAEDMVFSRPRTIHSVGGRHICVVPYESTFNGTPLKACQIAVSDDGGATWSLISGSASAVKGLRGTAPELHAAIEGDLQKLELGG